MPNSKNNCRDNDSRAKNPNIFLFKNFVKNPNQKCHQSKTNQYFFKNSSIKNSGNDWHFIICKKSFWKMRSHQYAKKYIKNPAKIPAQIPMKIDFSPLVFGSFFPRIFSKIESFSPILLYKITQTVVAIVSKIVGFIIKRRLICHFSNQANFSAGIIFSR